MSDRIRLGDDGTLDTVVVCRECGKEARYNFDGTGDDEDCAPLCASRVPFGECTCGRAERAYDAFVTWAIEDFDSEHECGDK